MDCGTGHRRTVSFDTIPHDALIKCLERRIVDRSVLKLIRMWLESPVVETDEHGKTKMTRPKQGTPQGGVITPPTILRNMGIWRQ
jgi:RNA-directed DNA polymerase